MFQTVSLERPDPPVTAPPATALDDTHDLRARASEIKFVVPREAGDAIAAWTRTQLAPDPYGGGPHADQYDTSTIYLDSAAFDVFHRRGSQGRAKYRVRRYGASDVAFVERKLRTRRMVAKRRTPVPLDCLSAILETASEDASLARWFTRRIAARGLGPACLVTYQRTARILATPSGLARLTIDTELAGAPASGLHFDPTDRRAILPGLAIVEFKFREVMPAVFRDAVARFQLEPTPVSKYRSAVKALELQDA